MRLFFIVLGALLVLEGIPYLMFPGKARQWALSLADAPDRALRLLGLVSVVSGLVIILVLILS